MIQPIRNNKNSSGSKPKRKKSNTKRNHPKYGTSKLEDYFAEQFLNKLGVKYIRQFEAKDIKRFYDFYLPDNHILIEIDGNYYHGKNLTYEEKNPMQKHNAWVDRVKDEWALEHSIPLLRIWEDDIRNNPSEVMKTLIDKIGIASEKKRIIDGKKQRH